MATAKFSGTTGFETQGLVQKPTQTGYFSLER